MRDGARPFARAAVGAALSSTLALALGATACGGGARRAPDGGPPPSDASSASDAADTAEAGVATDGADAPEAPPKPDPVASPASRLVVPGPAALVGHGADSCTNEPGAAGDRWCAFARPAGDYFELWVLDVSKASAGTAVACDGTDASCLRLTQRLYKSRAAGFADFGFNGDTLVYGENPDRGDSTSSFLGVLSAWRPGLAAGHALTSEAGVYCAGRAGSDAVLCFANRAGDGLLKDLTIDLLAGHLATVGASGLPKMDTLLLTSTADAPGAPPRYGFDLSPDGQYVAWSTRAPGDPVEALHASLLDGKGQAIAVARDVSQWAISPDGAAWYWLAGYNYDVAGAPAGTLQTAAFPEGGGPTTLASSVGDFDAVGARGLWLRTGVAAEVGTLQWMADRLAPAVAVIDAKVLAVLDQARDGSRFLYAKTFEPVRPAPQALTTTTTDLVDVYVGAPGGAAPCVVSATPAASHALLSPRGDVVLWERYDAATGVGPGLATTVSSCATAPFATRLGGVLPAGDDGYLFLDDADLAAGEATLRYARVVNGGLAVVDPPLQTRAASVFAPLAPALPAVAYTVATGTAADGLYLAPLPTGTPAADASVEAPSGTDASGETAPDGGAP
jgi:hypothetical protein